jgi:methionyl-tRNA formyltransferase
MELSSAKVVVFAYDFPHRKSQDFLLRLFMEGVPVHTVLAAPRVDLGIPGPSVRSKIRHRPALHPRKVAERIGARYEVVAHDGEEALTLLRSLRPDLGIVAGARILSAEMIDAFPAGIINFHPGLIPEVRGLDAMLWAVHEDQPQGVTAHLIDKRVDAGRILQRMPIPLQMDDTPFDLQERLYEVQLEMLLPAIEKALEDGGSGRLTEAVGAGTTYHRKMPAELERETLAALPDYLERHAG